MSLVALMVSAMAEAVVRMAVAAMMVVAMSDV